ncbi:MAG: diacylglycerol kinase [Alphaproteobacteria bacterium]|nr:diacylglycerol kinase [Alphaproteobacteria bacterium]
MKKSKKYNPFRNLKHSYDGFQMALSEDTSFRVSCMQFVFGVLLATGLVVYFNWSGATWLILTASLFPMIIIECVNTSIEAVTDKASPERSHLAQKAKDIGSAAVLLTRFFIALCWITAIVLAV